MRCKDRVFAVVDGLELPTGIERIRVDSNLKNWESTKSILLELAMDGEIGAIKTSHGYLFMNKNKQRPGPPQEN